MRTSFPAPTRTSHSLWRARLLAMTAARLLARHKSQAMSARELADASGAWSSRRVIRRSESDDDGSGQTLAITRMPPKTPVDGLYLLRLPELLVKLLPLRDPDDTPTYASCTAGIPERDAARLTPAVRPLLVAHPDSRACSGWPQIIAQSGQHALAVVACSARWSRSWLPRNVCAG